MDESTRSEVGLPGDLYPRSASARQSRLTRLRENARNLTTIPVPTLAQLLIFATV